MELLRVSEPARAGRETFPLLVGVLRGWSMEMLPENGNVGARDALALLGEIGDTAFAPPYGSHPTSRRMRILLPISSRPRPQAAPGGPWACLSSAKAD